MSEAITDSYSSKNPDESRPAAWNGVHNVSTRVEPARVGRGGAPDLWVPHLRKVQPAGSLWLAGIRLDNGDVMLFTLNTIDAVLTDLLLLGVFNVLFFMLSFLFFLRYDIT